MVRIEALGQYDHNGNVEVKHPDAEFIALARSDVPYLLDRIDELQAAITAPCLLEKGNLIAQLGSLYKYMQGIDDDVAEQWGQWAKELQARFGKFYAQAEEGRRDD
jgi:hypothetical protein